MSRSIDPMVTVVSDSAALIFQHIPKCAGSSVSRQLAEQVDFDRRFQWGRKVEVEGVGVFRGAHLTLAVMRDLFPETFEKYGRFRTYAVVRDPAARFRSAVGEYLRVHERLSLARVEPGALGRMVDEIMREAARNPVWLPDRYVHFTRQVDYVHLDGQRLIQHIYGVDALDHLARDLERNHGLRIDPRRTYNTRKDKALMHGMPKGRNGSLERAARGIWMRLPEGARRRALAAANRFLPEPRIPAATRAVIESDTVRDFVAEFYAPDARLWSETRPICGATVVRPAPMNGRELSHGN